MKKIIILLAISGIFFTACEEELFIEPPSDLSLANFFQNENDVELAVIGAYDALQSNGQYAVNFKFFMEIRSDHSYVEDLSRSGGQRGEFDIFTLNPANTFVNDTWVSCYQGIQRCNVILNRIDEVNMDESLKNTWKGEVLFIRALTYFNVVRIWGDAPLILTETDDAFESFDHTRERSEAIFTQIIEDLNQSIQILPQINEAGRVTRGAAQTLMGKVYLTLKRFDEAEASLKSVIDGGNYRLLDNYMEIFGARNENNDESIFEIQFESGGIGEGSLLATDHAPINANELVGPGVNTVGDNLPTPALFKLYSENDARKASIGQLDDGRLYSRKYLDSIAVANDAGINVIVLRYADVLLMYAEALNETGQTAAAMSYLNQVRDRAGVKLYESGELATQEAMRQAIADERQLELSMENHRWFDLVRTGKAIDVMNQHEYPNGNISVTVTEEKLLFPIPLTQIDASSGNLTQNPGF